MTVAEQVVMRGQILRQQVGCQRPVAPLTDRFDNAFRLQEPEGVIRELGQRGDEESSAKVHINGCDLWFEQTLETRGRTLDSRPKFVIGQCGEAESKNQRPPTQPGQHGEVMQPVGDQ